MGLASKLKSKPGAMILGGLVFWVMAWAIDMWTHIQEFGIAEGEHAHGGSALMRVNIPLTGAPLIVIGLVMLVGSVRLSKRGGFPLLVASFALMTDGLLHAFAFNDHLGNLASASFFAFVAPAQVVAGLALSELPRRFDRPLLYGTFAIFVLYLGSRAVPFAPLGWPEPVEALDVASKALEAVFLASMLAVISASRARAKAKAEPAAAAEP